MTFVTKSNPFVISCLWQDFYLRILDSVMVCVKNKLKGLLVNFLLNYIFYFLIENQGRKLNAPNKLISRVKV